MTHKRSLVVATALFLAIGLTACNGRHSAPTPALLPTDLLTNLRGQDSNENGIRDSIETATGGMTTDVTERLRMLAYAWSLEQGMEVAMLGDDAALRKTAGMIADSTACVMQTDSNASIAKSLIDIYQLTVDTPLRKEAWDKMKARTMDTRIDPSAQPCTATDSTAVSILKQTGEKFKAREEERHAAAQAPAAAASAPAETAQAKK